jgi:hypothetical protein
MTRYADGYRIEESGEKSKHMDRKSRSTVSLTIIGV